MNFWRMTTKIFAFFLLIFANFLFVQAQTDSNSSVYQLPAGTKILVKMDNEINSKVSSVNDTFTTTIAEPVKVRETVVIPIGAVIEGRITKVKRAAVGRKHGSLTIVFHTLRFRSGEKRDIEGILVNKLESEQSETASALTIIGGTAIGGLLGAISKANNGALIGAGIGGGVGTAVAFLKKGKDVSINTDEKFEIELTKEVNLPVTDY